MPEISRFLGIIIVMYFNDHNPPHFNVRYNEYKANILIRDLSILNGELPPKVHALVIEWASYHKEELMENWDLARAGEALYRIDPLE